MSKEINNTNNLKGEQSMKYQILAQRTVGNDARYQVTTTETIDPNGHRLLLRIRGKWIMRTICDTTNLETMKDWLKLQRHQFSINERDRCSFRWLSNTALEIKSMLFGKIVYTIQEVA